MPVIEITKRNNETALEHHKRLVYGKLVDKTLADIDYAELSEALYGQYYSSDFTRRMMYGSKKTLELVDSEGYKATEDSDLISKLDLKIAEYKKEKQKFYDQRREHNKYFSAEGRQEHLYDQLAKAAECLNETVGCMFERGSTAYTDGYLENDALLVFSDWHYGMKTDNIFNEYNTEICKERVRNTVDEVISRLQTHRCRNLNIFVIGDLFHGGIHAGTRVASEELVCEQIMQVSEILAQAVDVLSDYVENVYVYMTYGNHARTVQKKEDSVHRDNMERIIPWWLKQRLQNRENVYVDNESSNEFLAVTVRGHDFCATHGDLDNVRSSPRLISTLFHKKYGRDIEYIILGDKHHRESFEELGVTSVICGALCGADDYANSKRLYSTPSQLLLIVNEKNGVDAEYRIKCE